MESEETVSPVSETLLSARFLGKHIYFVLVPRTRECGRESIQNVIFTFAQVFQLIVIVAQVFQVASVYLFIIGVAGFLLNLGVLLLYLTHQKVLIWNFHMVRN